MWSMPAPINTSGAYAPKTEEISNYHKRRIAGIDTCPVVAESPDKPLQLMSAYLGGVDEGKMLLDEYPLTFILKTEKGALRYLEEAKKQELIETKQRRVFQKEQKAAARQRRAENSKLRGKQGAAKKSEEELPEEITSMSDVEADTESGDEDELQKSLVSRRPSGEVTDPKM